MVSTVHVGLQYLKRLGFSYVLLYLKCLVVLYELFFTFRFKTSISMTALWRVASRNQSKG